MIKSIASAILLLTTLTVLSTAKADSFDHFEYDNTGVSWINAYLLGIVSHYAYRGKLSDVEGKDFTEKARNLYRGYGLDVVDIINVQSGTSDTQAVILGNDRALIVAFSGSEGQNASIALKDWVLTDARLTFHQIDDVNVHSGFYNALAIAYAEVKESVKKYADGREIWVTGHSLGGALAILAAYKLDIDNIPVRGVVTFAAPKVGDRALADVLELQLGERFQRWVVASDPVPRVPPYVEKYPYVAAGITNVIFGDGEVDLDVDEDPGGVPNPGAHSMTVYVNYLYRALPDRYREDMPAPPSICRVGQSNVGNHPEDGLPYCKQIGSRKISEKKCKESGGSIVGEWCAFSVAEKYRYRVRKLKP